MEPYYAASIDESVPLTRASASANRSSVPAQLDDGIAHAFVSTAASSCLRHTAFFHPASPENRPKRRKLPAAHLLRRYGRYHCPIVLLPHIWPNRSRFEMHVDRT